MHKDNDADADADAGWTKTSKGCASLEATAAWNTELAIWFWYTMNNVVTNLQAQMDMVSFLDIYLEV